MILQQWGFFLITSVFSTYHLELDLDTKTLLLDSSHSCGEGLPHAGGSSQGQLGAALQTGNRARQHCGSAGPAHKQPADVLPVVAQGSVAFVCMHMTNRTCFFFILCCVESHVWWDTPCIICCQTVISLCLNHAGYWRSDCDLD